MFFARLKRTTQTVRFRLLLWIAGILLVSGLALLGGLRQAVHHALQSEMDQVLVGDLNEIEYILRDQPLDLVKKEMESKARGHAQYGWYVRFFGRDGSVLWSNAGAPATVLPLDRTSDIAPHSRNGYRVAQRRVKPHKKGEVYLVRVGARLDVLDTSSAHVDRVTFSAAAILFVAAPLVGYWLAGRLTRPLAEISATMGRLRPSQLDERLPLRNTGDELDRLSKAFNSLLDRIASYLGQRRDFLANSAHELRTPLAAIRSAVEVAASGQGDRAGYVELLEGVIDECTALETLVNQLLILAETESDTLVIQGQRVDLTKLVVKAIEVFRPAAESYGIELETGPLAPVVVEGNDVHLRHVLNNLLDNALSFTRSGGRVTLSLEIREPGRVAVLSVRDTGIGISADDLPHVFERFFRCDRSRTRSPDARGTGLGLSICQAVINAHGGKISARSTLGEGTTFVVELPLAQPLDEGMLLSAAAGAPSR